MKNCILINWESWRKEEDIPEPDPNHWAFNNKVSFFEAITASLCQLGLSSFIIKVFGISHTILGGIVQLFNLTMCISRLIVAFILVRNICITVLFKYLDS